MKPIASLLGAACGLALLAGCQSSSTTSARVQEKAAVISTLPPEQQQKIAGGVVEVGYTADMVYVALGRPDSVAVTADGKVGIWNYENYLPSAVVSPQPFYGIRPHPKGPPAFRSGGSAPGAQGGAVMGDIARGPREGGPLGTGWAMPNITPVTLHILFAKGRVCQLAVN
jgi:hypothetical protein